MCLHARSVSNVLYTRTTTAKVKWIGLVESYRLRREVSKRINNSTLHYSDHPPTDKHIRTQAYVRVRGDIHRYACTYSYVSPSFKRQNYPLICKHSRKKEKQIKL